MKSNLFPYAVTAACSNCACACHVSGKFNNLLDMSHQMLLAQRQLAGSSLPQRVPSRRLVSVCLAVTEGLFMPCCPLACLSACPQPEAASLHTVTTLCWRELVHITDRPSVDARTRTRAGPPAPCHRKRRVHRCVCACVCCCGAVEGGRVSRGVIFWEGGATSSLLHPSCMPACTLHTCVCVCVCTLGAWRVHGGRAVHPGSHSLHSLVCAIGNQTKCSKHWCLKETACLSVCSALLCNAQLAVDPPLSLTCSRPDPAKTHACNNRLPQGRLRAPSRAQGAHHQG